MLDIKPIINMVDVVFDKVLDAKNGGIGSSFNDMIDIISKMTNSLGISALEAADAINQLSRSLCAFVDDSKCFIGADTAKIKNDYEILTPITQDDSITWIDTQLEIYLDHSNMFLDEIQNKKLY